MAFGQIHTLYAVQVFTLWVGSWKKVLKMASRRILSYIRYDTEPRLANHDGSGFRIQHHTSYIMKSRCSHYSLPLIAWYGVPYHLLSYPLILLSCSQTKSNSCIAFLHIEGAGARSLLDPNVALTRDHVSAEAEEFAV